MQLVAQLKKLLDSQPALSKAMALSVQDTFFFTFNYTSCKLAGCNLTQDTASAMLEGYRVKETDRDFTYQQMLLNQAAATNFMVEQAQAGVPLSLALAQEFNRLVLATGIYAEQAGQFRNQPIHVEGAKNFAPDPEVILSKLSQLIMDYNNDLASGKAVLERAIRFHADFLHLQPFVDGNGRVARLILNFELMKAGYPLLCIQPADKNEYFKCLSSADRGNYSAINELLHLEMVRSLNVMLNAGGRQLSRSCPELAQQVAELIPFPHKMIVEKTGRSL
ncbi:Fic family protein [Psittacicella hinzii]|uniref:Fido domain-containing protein n=1 Tax=Psittacicella hinzii TaxID=2028575 RepID=A0A3A1YN38_9GAMM|nr:Fic family protein [Psittacicella hinzii]RIY39693.1 hypothetical protein CKF58_01730 [Psittacicella hinzii]